MKVLTIILMVFMDLFMIVLFFCALILALIVLDYLLDSELKSELNRVLGPRKRIKKVRGRVLNLFHKIDTQDHEWEKKKQQIDIHDDAFFRLDFPDNFQNNEENRE